MQMVSSCNRAHEESIEYEGDVEISDYETVRAPSMPFFSNHLITQSWAGALGIK